MKKADILKSLFFALALMGWSFAAKAQDPLCDVDLFNQMVERARLQSQRETVTVENLIYKPDSVMEYTCAERAIDFYPSALTNPDSQIGPGDVAPDKIIIQNFLFQNFGHTYLGGRAAAGTPMAPPGATYVCDAMAAVWAMAVCQQFAPTEPEDGFYDLTAFLSSNILRYPTLCTNPPINNFGNVPAVASIVFTSATTPPTDCGLPVATGVVVTTPRSPASEPARPDVYNEKICPNPTCTYRPTGLDTGVCEP